MGRGQKGAEGGGDSINIPNQESSIGLSEFSNAYQVTDDNSLTGLKACLQMPLNTTEKGFSWQAYNRPMKVEVEFLSHGQANQ